MDRNDMLHRADRLRDEAGISTPSSLIGILVVIILVIVIIRLL